MSQDQYAPAEVSHSELLKYHLHISTKVDNEIALKEAKKTVALLENPPVHQIHQHAQISHDAQKTPVNENNKAVINRVKKDKKEVEAEKKIAKEKVVPEYKVLTPEETAKALKAMEQQVKNASARTITPVASNPGSTTIAEVSATANTAPAPPWLAGK